MKLVLYYNKSDNNVMGKILNYIGTLEGNLRVMTSLLNPSIDVEISNSGIINYNIEIVYDADDVENNIEYTDDGNNYEIGLSLSSNILKCNYCYIEEFNRYYFINDIIVKSTNIFTLVLNIDVLETYKDVLNTKDAFIKRASYGYDGSVYENRFIIDELQDFEYQKSIDYKIPNFNAHFFDTSVTNYLNSYCVVATIYSQDDLQIDTSNITAIADLPSVSGLKSGKTQFTQAYMMRIGDVADLCDYLISKDSMTTFVPSLIAYPFNLNSIYTGNIYNLYIGKTKKTDVYGATILGSASGVLARLNQSNYIKLFSFDFTNYQN